jgi:hypothetical protein
MDVIETEAIDTVIVLLGSIFIENMFPKHIMIINHRTGYP